MNYSPEPTFWEFLTQKMPIDPQIISMAIIALIPIAVWIWFFQVQHHEKRSYVVLTFLAGMLSIVPIKLYERYWDVAILSLENINLFHHIERLTHIPAIDTFLAYVIAFTVVSLGLYIFVAVMMFLLEVISGADSTKVFEKKALKIAQDPLLFVMVGIIFGIAAFFLNIRFEKAVWFFVIVGALEEFVKHLITRFSDEFNLKSVADAIQFSIIVALGFAFVENIIYFLDISGGVGIHKELIIFVLLRSTVSVTAHVCFSAIMGYYYGIAHFASEIYQEECKRKKHPVIKFVHRVLHCKSSTVFKDEKMLEGMLLAMSIHALFNMLLEKEQMSGVLLLLGVLFTTVLHLLHRTQVHRRIGTVTA